MSGQLGDVPPPPMASPKKQPPAPPPSATPTPAAVDSKPVEAAELTPPAPESKVLPTTIPTPDHVSPDHDASLSVSSPPPESTPRETPQSNEQKQPLVAEPACEPVIYPEQESPISDSVAESVPAIPAVEQQQKSSERIAEDCPQPATEQSNSDQQTQSAPVSDIPAVQQAQSISLNAREDLSVSLQCETPNLLIDTGLDKTSVPAEVGPEPNPEISQSNDAAPLTVDEKLEPTTEKLPEGTTYSVEPKPVLVPEAVTQEVSVNLDSKPDSTAPNVKDEKIIEIELGESAEKPQIDEIQATPAVTVDTAFNVEHMDTTEKLGVDSVASDVKNEVTVEVQAEPEPTIEKPALTEDAPQSPVEAVEHASPVDNVEVRKRDETQQELSQEPAKFIESESSSTVSEKQPVSASEEKSQAYEVENQPVEKETEPVPTEKSPHAAPVAGGTRALDQTNEEKIDQGKLCEKVVIVEEIVKHEIHEKSAKETIKDSAEEKTVKEKVVEQETVVEEVIERAENKSSNGEAFEEEAERKNADAERATEVKADEGKAFEEEANEQGAAEKANDQKPQEEEGNKAELSPAPSITQPENVCPEIQEKVKTEEKSSHEEIETGTISESSPAKESLVEIVSFPERSEEKTKPLVEAEIEVQKEGKQKPMDTMLKADNESESVLTPPDSEEQTEDIVDESVQSAEMVISSAVDSETQVRGNACEEKHIQDEKEAGPQHANCTAENPHEVERETLAMKGSGEKQHEEVAELSIKEKEAKLDQIECESQPVAGHVQEAISFSEAHTVCHKDGTAQSDVGEITISKDDTKDFVNGGTSLSVAWVPVAEPEIPVVSVVGEQDKAPKEENSYVEGNKEEKDQPLGKPSDEDAVAEVTIV